MIGSNSFLAIAALLFGQALFLPFAFGAPLTDGVSSVLEARKEPGLIELVGQENFTSHFGLMAGYTRESYTDSIYSGWELGSNWLLLRILSDDWKSSVVVSLGLSGLQGEEHGHLAVWSRVDLDWESRQFLVALFSEFQRGSLMPGIDTGQVQVGYSPMIADTGSIQSWFLVAYFARSGIGEPRVLAVFRLVSSSWRLEVGTSLSSPEPILNFAIAL